MSLYIYIYIDVLQDPPAPGAALTPFYTMILFCYPAPIVYYSLLNCLPLLLHNPHVICCFYEKPPHLYSLGENFYILLPKTNTIFCR